MPDGRTSCPGEIAPLGGCPHGGTVSTFGRYKPQYSTCRTPVKAPLHSTAMHPAWERVLRRKRKAPRSAGNPWSSPAGLRPRTARDRGAHRSAAAALGYPRFGVTAAPPECRSPLRGRHLRRAATLVFHRITSFVGRTSQAAGPNPPGRRTAQVHRAAAASRAEPLHPPIVRHPAPDVNSHALAAARWRCDGSAPALCGTTSHVRPGLPTPVAIDRLTRLVDNKLLC